MTKFAILENRQLLADAIKASNSMKQVLVSLELPTNSKAYSTLRHWAGIHGLELKLGAGRYGGLSRRSLTSVEEIFCEGSYATHRTLKRYMLGYFNIPYVCANSACPVESVWNGLELTLQLDHVNGNSADHRIENLQLLCPNCHSQTSTYAGRNFKNTQVQDN